MIGLRNDYRPLIQRTETLQVSSIVATTSNPPETAILILDVSGPIKAGEIWEITGTVVAENLLSDGKNVFFRSEIWITTQPGNIQSGINPPLLNQSGPGDIGNLTPDEVNSAIFRDGSYIWPSDAFGPRYVKYFGAAAGSNIEDGDTIGIRNGVLGVKRLIPR